MDLSSDRDSRPYQIGAARGEGRMGEASALVLAVGLLFAPTARTQTQLRAQTRSRDTIDDPFKRIESVIDVRVEPVF